MKKQIRGLTQHLPTGDLKRLAGYIAFVNRISVYEDRNSRAEPRETVEMLTYNVFCWFSNLLTMLNKN